MEVENGSLEDEFRLQKCHFPLPGLLEKEYSGPTLVASYSSVPRLVERSHPKTASNDSPLATHFPGTYRYICNYKHMPIKICRVLSTLYVVLYI